MRSLGILGGTFDPVHYGHLIAAEHAYYEFALDKILIIPNASPPHKDNSELLNPEQRYHMVELAIKNNPALELSAREMNR
ncbi:MAG: adenylyltransferase/cytidyltransferase family protein, partial [Syntrophomonas sp.]